MKRKQELEIVLDCLLEHGVDVTEDVSDAVRDGLKRIRMAKYEERQHERAAQQGSA